MNEKEQTLADMKDCLLRLKAIKDHAQKHCNYRTFCYVDQATWNLKQAIKEEE